MEHNVHMTSPSLSTSLKGVLVIFMLSQNIAAQNDKGIIRGTVQDMDSKVPLAYVNVMVSGTSRGDATDSNGYFIIKDIDPGIQVLIVSMMGYQERRDTLWIKAGDNYVRLELIPMPLIGEEIVVTPMAEQYDASGIRARLDRQMIVGTPGSAQDIFWVVQTLPGVTSDGDNSKLYVRGGSPDENLILYDGITIRNPFHFDFMGGGFFSTFNSRLVKKVEFYSGGFSAQYGDRLSSVMIVENRRGDFDKVKGELSVSMSDASGVIEVPLKKLSGSALVSVRRSYFDLFMNRTDLGADYSVLPYFFDTDTKLDFDLSSRHRLTLTGIYSNERISGYFDENPHYTGNLEWQNTTKTLGGRLRSIISHDILSDIVVSWSEAGKKSSHPGDAYENLADREIDVKQDWTLLFPAHELHFGGWFIRENQNVDINLPMDVAVNFEEMRIKGKGEVSKPSLYIEDKWKIISNIALNYGLRYDYVNISRENSLAPRVNLAYAWNEHMSVSADYGWYFQAPNAYELALNPQLKSKKAESLGFGVKHEVENDLNVGIDVYNKRLSQLVTIDSSWNLRSDGYGYARGVELHAQLTKQKLFGWLSYTYSISKRKVGRSDKLHFFDFDRPHILSLVMNYSFTKQWQTGIRFRYGSGRPFTPAASAWWDASAEHWKPIPAEHNSDRYPDYNRLDVRLTRKFGWSWIDLDAYIELLNVFNVKNVIHYMWDDTYSNKEPATIFPFLPILGLSAKF